MLKFSAKTHISSQSKSKPKTKPNSSRNYRPLLQAGLILSVGLGLLYGGHLWEVYTFTHSPNPSIDFNFGAAIMMMLGIGIASVGALYALAALTRFVLRRV